MLNHTYTSVKNANLVDCGKKQHIASQPSPLLKDNFLGEFRTELDKKKVLANLGVATDLSLEWEYIKGDIGRSEALMQELDSRTTYTTQVGEFKDKVISIIEGIQYLETIVGGEQEGEDEQNERLKLLEETFQELVDGLEQVNKYLKETIEIDIDTLKQNLEDVSKQIANINDLIKISSKANNALVLIPENSEQLAEGETPGLYVPDLEPRVKAAEERFTPIETDIDTIQQNLTKFVTKEDLGGDSFDFVDQSEFDQHTALISNIQEELKKTVKTGEDGHVDTLFVNTISKNNNNENIKITDSFEVDSGIPLDVRFVVKTIDELHSLKPLVCYAGMGVIVSDLASLYILREPANGIIDEEYIKDAKGINWKCPEDLVIEVLTLEEYDQKEKSGSINPNMFYYIHEEVTEEPLRKDFETDEEYAEALDKWLRVLLQKYMSAVWGLEIEKLVSDKATQGLVKSLEEEIQSIDALLKSIAGGTGDLNLKDLNDLVLQNSEELKTLTLENGTIPTILENLSTLQDTITKDYVTKEEITIENPELEYIFVKKSAFDTYKDQHEASVAQQVTTETLKTNTINLGESQIVVEESDLIFNGNLIALSKEVPNIEMIDNNIFKDLKDEEKEDNVYYYVYDLAERYVLDSEFTSYKTYQTGLISSLSEDVTTNKLTIGTIDNLTTENKNNLVYAINELHTYISKISSDLDTLITGEGIISSMQASIDQLSKDISEKYVTIESITIEDPEASYIFVKNSEFETYKTTLANSQAQSISTNKINTNTINILDNLLTTEESSLLFNEEPVALEKNVPNIIIMDSALYNPDEAEDDVYYYLTEDEARYVLASELDEYKTSQIQVKNDLLDIIQTNKNLVGEISVLTTENKDSLVLAINELVSKIGLLTTELEALKALHSTPELG